MKRRDFLASAIALATLPGKLAAQVAPKPARIGWLTAQQESSLTPYLAAMRAGFSDLGYVEGRNLAIDYRYGNDAVERIPELAAELVKLPVDLIVAQGAAVSGGTMTMRDFEAGFKSFRQANPDACRCGGDYFCGAI